MSGTLQKCGHTRFWEILKPRQQHLEKAWPKLRWLWRDTMIIRIWSMRGGKGFVSEVQHRLRSIFKASQQSQLSCPHVPSLHCCHV